MKRRIGLLTFFLCLIFIVSEAKSAFPVPSTNTFNQGIYKVSDFNPTKDNVYTVSNISSIDNMSIIITDEEQNILQAIRLKPNSERHNTIPILPNYTVILLGKGTAYINPHELTQ